MVTCCICGYSCKSDLSKHLCKVHQINGREYTEKYNMSYASDELMGKWRANGTRQMNANWEKDGFKEEHSKRVSERNNLNWQNTEYRQFMSDNGKAQWDDPKYKAMMREIIKASWQDENVRNKHCESMREFCNSEEGLRSIMSRWRNYTIEYNGNIYKSSWEVVFVKFLEKHSIRFEYESIYSKYIRPTDNKEHTYFPDFYLPDYNLIIEVKADWALESDINTAKMNSIIDKGYRFIYVSSEIIKGLKSGSETIESNLLKEIYLN